VKITLLRHCEVVEEYRGKYNGHIDIALSEKGKKDAQNLAKEFQNQHFDLIYCSDLLRAKETLQALQLQLPTIYTDTLREKSWGRHEGKSFEEINEEGIEYKDFHQWINALDGEDIESYKRRVENYFSQTICKSDAQNILLVTHSGFIKTLLSITKNISLEEAFTIPLSYGSSIVLDGF